jgi:uncharacterized RDD family membrane protein YckC
VSEHRASALPHEAEVFQGQPAGLVSRGVAAVVDVAVVGATLVAAYVGLSAAIFVIDPRHFNFPSSFATILSLAAACTVSVVYLTVGWWIAGRTYGCAVMGLRVQSRTRSRGEQNMGFVGSLVRALLCTFFPVGLLWCAVNTKARAVHDLVVRSEVIYDWRHRER